ncbi:hypothetical protein [Roseibium sp.]|uniref:hypothetical protein n=1 Tax=Roseibium sp. TaxID=1936156 RepID=UPI003A979764
MSSEEMPEASGPWFDKKTLVISWLLAFFPVGLFGLWKGSLFNRNWKIGITVLIAVLFVLVGINFTHPIYVLVLFPLAIALLWRDADITRPTVYGFAGGWVLVLALFLFEKGSGPTPNFASEVGGSCAAVMQEGNCTYYRDSDCNVIARQCE